MMDRRKSMTLIYLSIAVVFFLLLPQAMRILQGNPTLTGKEPYFHARMVEQVMQNRIFEQDSLVYGGRTLFYTPYHLIAAGFSFLIGIELVLRILPMICGIISMVLFYKILKKYSYDKFTRIVAVLVLASSPAFIYVFTTTQDSLAIALTIFGTYFFVNGKKKMHLVSFLFFLAASLFSLFNTLVIIIPLLMYSFIKGRRQKFSMATSIVLLGAYMINPSPVFYNLITGSPQMLKGFISDLGGPIGIGAFYLMLVIIGLVYSWQENRKYYPLYMILVLYTISFYFARGYVLGYMNFFMVVFAAQGIKIIKDLNWQMKMIKNLTFIVIACGLLFSMISFSGRLAEMPPNENMEIGFDWLKQNSKPDDVVLSHYSNGYFIEYYASRPVLMDSYISHIQDFNQKYLDSYDLFNTYELKHAEEILKKYGIVYIVVTKDMKEGIVWESPDEGLLHLMKDPEAFKSVYISEELEIWKYLKKPQ